MFLTLLPLRGTVFGQPPHSTRIALVPTTEYLGYVRAIFFKKKKPGASLTISLLAGILRTVETSTKGRENHMKDALQDLEALMVKAKDMVKLAAELNEKLTTATAAATSSSSSTLAGSSTLSLVSQPEEVTFIRSSLSQLGVQISNTSVTLDMMKDERKWFDELARELARVLQGPPNLSSNNGDTVTGGMMKDRGIIALDEVWGGWNRARGVGTSPPLILVEIWI